MNSELKRIENLDAVVDALEQGKSEQFVSRLEDREYYRELNLHRKERYQHKKQQEREDKIKRIIAQEIVPYFSWQKGRERDTSFAALKERTGLSESMLGRIGEQEMQYAGSTIQLKEFLYDSFVREALGLREIAAILKMNIYQRVQQYLQNTGQYPMWRQQYHRQLDEKLNGKEEQQELKQEIQDIASLLLAKAVLDLKDNWPRQIAILVDSRKQKNPTNIPIHKLEELFWHYQQAVEHNAPVGLNYLSEMTSLQSTVISRQLRLAGLPVLNPTLRKGWMKKLVHLSKEEERRIKNSKNTFPRPDWPYFVGLPLHMLQSRKVRLPSGRETKYEIPQFSYRDASEIYHAQKDFTPLEIQYGLEMDDATYHKYLHHQRDISKEIVFKLRQIYPELGTKIKHPYPTPEIRQLQQEQTLEATIFRAINTAVVAGARGLLELESVTGFNRQTLQAYSKKRGIALPLKYTK